MSAKNETTGRDKFQCLVDAASNLLQEQAKGTKKEETQSSRKLHTPEYEKVRRKLRRLIRKECDAKKNMILPYMQDALFLEIQKSHKRDFATMLSIL